MTILGKETKKGTIIFQAGRWIKVEKITQETEKALHIVGSYIDEPEILSKAYATIRKGINYKIRQEGI